MPNAPKTPTHSIRIADDVWDALRDIASATDLTVSDVIRLALTDFIHRHR